MRAMQRAVFDIPDPFLNPRVNCDALPGVDLDLWKERVTCKVDDVSIETGDARRVSPCVMCTCTKEGPLCQSLKIENCFHLAQSFRLVRFEFTSKKNFAPSGKHLQLTHILSVRRGSSRITFARCSAPSPSGRSPTSGRATTTSDLARGSEFPKSSSQVCMFNSRRKSHMAVTLYIM